MARSCAYFADAAAGARYVQLRSISSRARLLDERHFQNYMCFPVGSAFMPLASRWHRGVPEGC